MYMYIHVNVYSIYIHVHTQHGMQLPYAETWHYWFEHTAIYHAACARRSVHILHFIMLHLQALVKPQASLAESK